MKKSKQKTIHTQRRFGHHQKRNKGFHDTYLPYLPMTLLLFLSVFLSGYTPRQATLAYATEMSHQNLLTATNEQRTQNGKTSLKINERLNSAAQAKANDMVAKNYWSHNTPEGNEPWVFITGASYEYLKAGENLAYGFSSSSATVNGWMNSPSHRDNLLDGEFQEVGFGYANSDNYNNAGEETVVVAMYGKPYVLASVAEPAPPQPTATPAAPVQQNNNPISTPPTETTIETSTQPATETIVKQIADSDKKATAPVVSSTQPVTQIETITHGTSPWIVSGITFITGILATLLLLRHGFRFRRLIRDSQNFVTHHPLIDSTIIALIILGITLTRTVGFIL